MAAGVVVHGYETSNNYKVRVALGYKGIAYEFRTIDPADRSEIIRLSGQYLTPVMVHGDRVLFDSAAIMRYLDANFRDTPRLYGASLIEQWEIEDREFFARTRLAGPMMELVHHRHAGGGVDEATRARCADDFSKAAATVIEWMRGREWLVGDEMTAADVTAAAVLYRIGKSGMFELPAGAKELAGWMDRVMRWDRHRVP